MFEEDFSKWDTGALVTVPPETLEYVDLVGLVTELQRRLENYVTLLRINKEPKNSEK